MAKLQNIVSTVKLCEKSIDLENIANSCENVTYNPRKFNAAIVRMKNPKATGLLFSSGRMVCTGTKRFIDNEIACENIRKLLEKTGVKNQKWKTCSYITL